MILADRVNKERINRFYSEQRVEFEMSVKESAKNEKSRSKKGFAGKNLLLRYVNYFFFILCGAL